MSKYDERAIDRNITSVPLELIRLLICFTNVIN